MSVGNVSTPFVDSNSFITEEAETESPKIRSVLTAGTPFVSVYESADGEAPLTIPSERHIRVSSMSSTTRSSMKPCSNC